MFPFGHLLVRWNAKYSAGLRNLFIVFEDCWIAKKMDMTINVPEFKSGDDFEKYGDSNSILYWT